MPAQTTWSTHYLAKWLFGQDKVWITAHREAKEIATMDREHVLNTLLYLERVASRDIEPLLGGKRIWETPLYKALKKRVQPEPSLRVDVKIDTDAFQSAINAAIEQLRPRYPKGATHAFFFEGNYVRGTWYIKNPSIRDGTLYAEGWLSEASFKEGRPLAKRFAASRIARPGNWSQLRPLDATHSVVSLYPEDKGKLIYLKDVQPRLNGGPGFRALPWKDEHLCWSTISGAWGPENFRDFKAL